MDLLKNDQNEGLFHSFITILKTSFWTKFVWYTKLSIYHTKHKYTVPYLQPGLLSLYVRLNHTHENLSKLKELLPNLLSQISLIFPNLWFLGVFPAMIFWIKAKECSTGTWGDFKSLYNIIPETLWGYQVLRYCCFSWTFAVTPQTSGKSDHCHSWCCIGSLNNDASLMLM